MQKFRKIENTAPTVTNQASKISTCHCYNRSIGPCRCKPSILPRSGDFVKRLFLSRLTASLKRNKVHQGSNLCENVDEIRKSTKVEVIGKCTGFAWAVLYPPHNRIASLSKSTKIHQRCISSEASANNISLDDT